ncbi:MAG: membrane protein [Alphaproteobacteria bacterium]
MNFKTIFPNLKEKQMANIKTAVNIIGAILRDFIQGKLPLRATSLVYTTILSFVPLLALSFSVLKSFGAHNQLAPFLDSLLAPLGDKGHEISQNVLLFVDNIQVGVLGAIGLGFLLFTVVSLVQKIESAFNNIWHIEKARPHMQRFTGYLSVITVGPIVMFSLIGLKTKFTTNPMVADTLGLSVSTGVMPYIIDTISAVAMPILLFTFMCKAIPNTKVNWWPAITAGIATAYMWKGIASGFGSFMSNSGNYDAIYSSFAIILLVFIWLYLNWLIILIGGSLSFYLQNPEQAKISLHKTELSYQDKLFNALYLIKNIHKKYVAGEQPITLAEISQKLGSHIFAQDIIHGLVNAKIIAFAENEGEELILIKSIDKLTLLDVINTLSNRHKKMQGKARDKELSTFISGLEKNWADIPLKQIFKN